MVSLPVRHFVNNSTILPNHTSDFSTDSYVDSKSLVKGYEYAADRFVVITESELEGLNSDIGEKAVGIAEFDGNDTQSN